MKSSHFRKYDPDNVLEMKCNLFKEIKQNNLPLYFYEVREGKIVLSNLAAQGLRIDVSIELINRVVVVDCCICFTPKKST